jgi:L-2-hydroxycarboxylate dehydrogenase (NAD+)
MIPRFKIKEKDLIRVPEASLREIVEKIFEKMGVPQDDCILAADVLVSADLRGVESHGVSNMLRKYIRDYRAGEIKSNPKWFITRESLSTASIDADGCLGIIMASKAMDIAIQKAKKTGIGMVTMKNSGHMGMISYCAMQAIKHDMIGLAMSSSVPTVLPTFGSEPRLGTNPIALAAPTITEAPFVYDAATSVISSNKIGLAKRLNVKLPSGWIADRQGTPHMEEINLNDSENQAVVHPFLLPLGSTIESGSHKGYGLSCVVEILSGILSGANFSLLRNGSGYAHTVVAYNIDSFMDVEEFKETMDEWLKLLKSTKPAPGRERVLYAGLSEAEYEVKNRIEGIPLHKEVVEWFHTICDELSISYTL